MRNLAAALALLAIVVAATASAFAVRSARSASGPYTAEVHRQSTYLAAGALLAGALLAAAFVLARIDRPKT